MNDLEAYFANNPGRLIHKWHHYFEIYDRHFSRFRGGDVCILEIGVSHGGSLQMWRNYFGSGVTVIGVDCEPRCKVVEEPGIHVEIGDQTDRGFWGRVKQKFPKIDIVIDDGGHLPAQQIVSFEELYGHIQPNGIYLCEDLHTNYWRSYGGGIRQPHTFVEYTKSLIDHLTAWHSEDHQIHAPTDFTKSTWGMHFYDSVAVVEKRPRTIPQQSTTGTVSF
jgi:23S rRNA U2552 (ribose-2'-O)-methylase RlmE/FtsJ